MYAYCENNPVKYTDNTGTLVWGFGLDISGAFGVRVGITISVIFDDNGNSGLIITSSFGGGTPQAAISMMGSISSADTINDTQGIGISGGGSVYAGIDYTFGTAQNGDLVYGGQVSVGLSALPYEMHGDLTKTILLSKDEVKDFMKSIKFNLISNDKMSLTFQLQ